MGAAIKPNGGSKRNTPDKKIVCESNSDQMKCNIIFRAINIYPKHHPTVLAKSPRN